MGSRNKVSNYQNISESVKHHFQTVIQKGFTNQIPGSVFWNLSIKMNFVNQNKICLSKCFLNQHSFRTVKLLSNLLLRTPPSQNHSPGALRSPGGTFHVPEGFQEIRKFQWRMILIKSPDQYFGIFWVKLIKRFSSNQIPRSVFSSPGRALRAGAIPPAMILTIGKGSWRNMATARLGTFALHNIPFQMKYHLTIVLRNNTELGIVDLLALRKSL